MANHPARWMDQFRDRLGQMASEEERRSRQFAQLTFYDERDAAAIYGSEMDAADRKRFWSTFDAVAMREGYQKPSIRLGIPRGVNALESATECWPVCLLIVALLTLLRRGESKRRKLRRTESMAHN